MDLTVFEQPRGIEYNEPEHVVTFDIKPSDDPVILGAQIVATLDSLIGHPNGARLIVNIQPVA